MEYDHDYQARPANDPDAFIVHRLRAKPIEYTVKIRHFVSGGRWMMSISLHDVSAEDDVQKERVAEDLRRAAELMEAGEWEAI